MEEKINLQQIVDALAEKNGISKKKADALVRTMFEVIQEALSEEKYVKIKGLGTFKLTEVDSRESIDVNTGSRIEIGGHVKVSFTPDTAMKELINKPFAHFQTVILNENTQLDDTEVVDYKDVLSEEDIELPNQEGQAVNAINSGEECQNVESTLQKHVETLEDANEAQKSNEIHDEASMEEVTAKAEVPIKSIDVEKAEVQDKAHDECEKLAEPQVLGTLTTAKADAVQVEDRKHSSLWKNFAVGLLLLLVGVFVCLAYTFFCPSDQFISNQPDQIHEINVDEKIVPDINPSPMDTIKEDEIATDSSDVVKEDMPEHVEPAQQDKPKRQPIALLSDTIEYKITGTLMEHTLKEGETIIKLSNRFYGSKKLWPYIAKYNKDIIKDVDKVPVGTKLRIPKLSPR